MNAQDPTSRLCGALADNSMAHHVLVPDMQAGAAFYRLAFLAKSRKFTRDLAELRLTEGGWKVGTSLLLVTSLEACRHDCFNPELYTHGKTPRLEFVFPLNGIGKAVERMLRAGPCVPPTLMGDTSKRLRYATIIDPFGTVWALTTPIEENERPLKLEKITV